MNNVVLSVSWQSAWTFLCLALVLLRGKKTTTVINGTVSMTIYVDFDSDLKSKKSKHFLSPLSYSDCWLQPARPSTKILFFPVEIVSWLKLSGSWSPDDSVLASSPWLKLWLLLLGHLKKAATWGSSCTSSTWAQPSDINAKHTCTCTGWGSGLCRVTMEQIIKHLEIYCWCFSYISKIRETDSLLQDEMV